MVRALILLMLLAAAPPGGASAGTAEEDLRWLNQRRAIDGIPGDVDVDRIPAAGPQRAA